MKKTLLSLAAAAVLCVALISTTMACPSCPSGKAPAKPAARKKIVSAVCPVMKNKIPDVTKAAGKSVYKGKTYYFCCAGCKPQFDKNPAKYVKSPKK